MKARTRKWLRGLAVGVGALAALAALAFAIAFFYYDREVAQQFEGRRWTVPAKVYAAPIELYVGLPFTIDDFLAELERLKYRAATELDRPGSYRRRRGRFEIAVRAARFADELRPAQIIAVTIEGNAISGLRAADGADIPVFRLDPLLIGSIFPIHGEDRIVLTPDDVPPLLPAAIKAVEDRKFDTHHGIDLEAIARALWVNLRAGKVEQGGSTLTQQLVKSYFLDGRRTLGRKLEEAMMALALEARYDKRDLMTAYINEIYLGQQGDRAIHGFGLASQFWFAKPLDELDLPELALLVAIVRGPPYYDPRRFPDRARKRRDLVLRVLAQQGIVSGEAAAAAAQAPLGVAARPSGGYYPAYLDFVRRTLRRDYKEADLTEAGLSVFTSFDPRAQLAAERAIETELARLDRTRPPPAGKSGLEGAAIVTLPQSGEVIAMVGGRNVNFDGLNRALASPRAIGSLVKPFVYLAAIESGRWNATSVLDDTPIEVPLSKGKVWRPQNYSRYANGPVSMVRALSESLNLATVHLGLDVGVAKVAQMFGRFGLDATPAPLPSLLLGAIDLPPIDVAQLYNGLANGGFHVPLRAVRAVVDAQGERLGAYPVKIAPVAAPDAVYQVDRMMTYVIARGTGRAAAARLPRGLIVAGKTGSSSDLRDGWFAGFSGTHLAVVWIGYDDNRPTGVTGSSGSLIVWQKIMSALDTTSWQPPMPESLEDMAIDYASGLRVTTGCSQDEVVVAVPRGTPTPYMAGCAPPSGIVDWLRGIIR
ncbi:MAG: penicillin-binding protein 1B [Steroidobacteraceae bacterium]